MEIYRFVEVYCNLMMENVEDIGRCVVINNLYKLNK